MTTETVCCIDMGTTQIKVALVTDSGCVSSSARSPSPECVTWNGFLSFDAQKYEKRVFETVRKVLDGCRHPTPRIEGVVLTNQRATFLAVGPDGIPTTPALSWQDTSSHDWMEGWVEEFGRDRFAEITGLPPSALWSLSKILRLRSLDTGLALERMQFVLLHDYVLHRLGAGRFFTDPSNASVTGLMDLGRRAWSPEILDGCGLSETQLPSMLPAASLAGAVSEEASQRTNLVEGTPLLVGGGDQQCAALGSGTLTPGEAALCLGTAAVVSCPMEEPLTGLRGEFYCTAHVADDRWVLEGIHNAFSTTILWVSEILECDTAEGFEHLVNAASPGASGVVFLPFLAGIGSPDFDSRATGTFVGLRQGHSRSDLARAALEGVCLEMRRILDAAERYTEVRRLLVSGGGLPGSASREIFGQILDRQIVEIENRDTSLAGAAILAWRGMGRFDALEAAVASLSPAARGAVQPARQSGVYEGIYERYCAVVEKARGALCSLNEETTSAE
jgi:xylulokinase